MNIHVLGSSSHGNCYVLSNEKEALIIEAGMSLMEVKKVLDFNIKKIVGVIVTHEHADHAKYVNEFLTARINVYMSGGTFDSIEIKSKYEPRIIFEGVNYRIGDFIVRPFETKHDAKEPIGFLIYHNESGLTLFATDTYYLPCRFAGLSNILIECNYNEKKLMSNFSKGHIHPALFKRTYKSHMSEEMCIKTLLANDLSKVNNIILIHLSDSNSNAEEFKKNVQNATGKNVLIADKGLSMNFNKEPF